MHKNRFLRILLMILLLTGCSAPENPPDQTAFHIRMLKIGKADAAILYEDNATSAILIDTGEEEDGAEIVENLQALGIAEISHMIISHYDKDHMGGAAYILAHYPVKEIIQPAYPGSGRHYQKYLDALEEFQSSTPDARITSVADSMEWTAGRLSCSLYAENDTDCRLFPPEEDNDRSLVIMVTYGAKRFLFTGDIEQTRTALLLEQETDLRCDWIKLPHHGSFHEQTEALLQAAAPQYAVICCSSKNPAAPETLQLLDRLNIPCWLTSGGDILFTCDGETIYAEQY